MKTILIVEDTELNVDLLTQLLEDDYQLLVARDGAESVLVTEKKARSDLDGYLAARDGRL